MCCLRVSSMNARIFVGSSFSLFFLLIDSYFLIICQVLIIHATIFDHLDIGVNKTIRKYLHLITGSYFITKF